MGTKNQQAQQTDTQNLEKWSQPTVTVINNKENIEGKPTSAVETGADVFGTES